MSIENQRDSQSLSALACDNIFVYNALRWILHPLKKL